MLQWNTSTLPHSSGFYILSHCSGQVAAWPSVLQGENRAIIQDCCVNAFLSRHHLLYDYDWSSGSSGYAPCISSLVTSRPARTGQLLRDKIPSNVLCRANALYS